MNEQAQGGLGVAGLMLTASLFFGCGGRSDSAGAQAGSGPGNGGTTAAQGGAPGSAGSNTGASSGAGAGNGGTGTGAVGPSGGSAGQGGSTGLPAGGGGNGGANGTCVQQAVEFESPTPTVELLVDRSGSMSADFGVQDRWNTIRDIVVDPTQGFVVLMQDKVRFGLTLYTGLSVEDPGGPSCPDLIQVPIAINNHQAIHDVFMANEVGAETPTAESVTAVTTKLDAFTEIGPKVIVLATDGDPEACADPSSNGTDAPRLLAEEAVQAAWDTGITTYVIAVGDEIQDLEHMQTLAQIGSGGDPSAAYYPAVDANSLIAAFSSILGSLASCDFVLNGTVEPGNVNTGVLTIDGVPLVYGDANGWEMPQSNTVRLLGAACDQIKLGASRLDIAFPCGAFAVQ